jgi:hypothetical protein
MAWRIALVTITALLVVASLARLFRDLVQARPIIYAAAHSYDIGQPYSHDYFVPANGAGYSLVGVTFSSVDAANSTITAQVAIELDQATVPDLVLLRGSRTLPLDPADAPQWAGLPVTLQLVTCAGPFQAACTSESSVPLTLGDLLQPAGGGALVQTVTRQVELSADANPSAYPQDEYAVDLDPQLVLPFGVEFKAGDSLPVRLILSGGTGLADKSVVVRSGGDVPGYQLVVSRLGLDQFLAFAMSLTPALLGFLMFCIAYTIRGRARRLDLGLTTIIGLLAAWLTILPLRSVLVPQELGATPLTRVDDLLIIDASVVLLFIAVTFVWVLPSQARTPTTPDKKDAEPVPAE